MNAHQTLDAVKEGKNICPLAVTKALYLTGDMQNRDKNWLTRETLHHLYKNPQGMTSTELAKLCYTNPNSVRISLHRNKLAYIHSWVQSSVVGKPAMIWKAVHKGMEVPMDAPHPNECGELDARLRMIGHKPQGLTQWITH